MIPAEVARRVAALHAAPTAAVEWTRDPAQSRVWRVDSAAGPAVVKRHGTAGKFHRERDALRRLDGRPWAPRLLAADDGLRLLVIALCPGDWPDTPAAWRAAGEALAALHREPVPPDPMPLSEAIARRLAGWLARAAPVLSDETLRRVEAAVGDGAAFAGVARVFCHRDFAPRNWRVGPDGVFRAFDFEHAGPDAPEVDLLRLYDGPFVARPDREAAFCAGYGARPDPDRLARLMALHGLATAAWGHLHGDALYRERGALILRRVGRSPPPAARSPR